MNTASLGICIKDFNDLHIVKEKVRPHEMLVLFYSVFLNADASELSNSESI